MTATEQSFRVKSIQTPAYYIDVRNTSGDTIVAPTIVKATGSYTEGSTTLTTIAVITSTSDIPIGILLFSLSNNTSGKLLDKGLYQITDFDTSGATMNDPVYFDTNGLLTLIEGSVIIGHVASLETNGIINFNFDKAIISNTASDGVKLTGNDFRLDIDGLSEIVFISPNDELAVYNTEDPYLEDANGKAKFSTIESHLTLNNQIGPLSVIKGGTNSTTPLNNNRIIISAGGEIIEATILTPNRVLESNSIGIPTAGVVTTTEMDRLSGITGNVQSQLDQKAVKGANTDITSVYLNNIGLKIKDIDSSHGLIIKPGSNLASDQTLIINTGNATRTITLNADTTLSGTNTGDQSISNLSDVSLVSVAEDDVLKYNADLGIWQNRPSDTGTVNAGPGVDFFFNQTASDISTYETLTRAPDSGSEQDESAVANNNSVLIDAFSSDSAGLGGSQIDAGIWNFNLWAYCSLLTLSSHLDIKIYKRTSGGTETLLFTVSSQTILVTSLANIELLEIQTAQQAFSINSTDRLIVKIYAVTLNIINTTVHFVHSGSIHYSNFSTPLVLRHNDTVGLQGGTTGQYYHITSTQATVVGNTSGTNTGDETLVTTGALINSATSKTTPVDADYVGLMDSAATNILKKLSWANLKATLKTYFDALYSAIGATFYIGTTSIANNRSSASQSLTGITSIDGSAATLTTTRTIDGQSFNGSANITVIAPGTHAATSKTTPVDADEIPIVDTEASNVLKKLTGTNLKAYLKTYFDTLYTGGGGASFSVTQAHTFVVGNPIYNTGSAYALAKADSVTTADALGIVSAVADANNFTLLILGSVTLTTGQWDVITGQSGGLTAGSDYYLSDTTAGMLTTTEPALSKLIIRAVSTTIAVVREFEPKESGVGNQIIDQEFTATASQTVFTLTAAPASKAYVFLTIDNLQQTDDAYTLSGTTLTLGTGVAAGIVVKVKYVRHVTFDTSIQQYLSRTTYSIADSGTQSLGSDTGSYEIFLQADAKTHAFVFFTNGDTDPVVEIPAGATISNVAATASKLNVYVTGGNLTVENKLGSTKTVVVYKRI